MQRVAETRGAELLREWLDSDDARTQESLAERLGVKQTTVSTWLGRMRPRLPVALLLEQETKIPVMAWGEELRPVRKPRTRKAA